MTGYPAAIERARDPLGYTYVMEWRPPWSTPRVSGWYERETTLGVRIDFWDEGEGVWRRGPVKMTRHGTGGGPHVICANQTEHRWRKGRADEIKRPGA